MPALQGNSDPLLPRIARGDPTAVEACMSRYAPLVWSLARQLIRDAGIMEEVVQDIFVDIWRYADRFDPALASEVTFVSTIARRRIIDRRRRAGRNITAELPDDAVIGGAPEPGIELVDARDEAQKASTALRQLKPQQRKLILMAVVDGLTHQEIATATGLPLGTVKSHIRRGLDQASQILGPSRAESRP